MKTLQNIHIDSSNAILVVVDVENEFCKPGGKLYNETSAQIMPGVFCGIQKLLRQARGANIPIVYIQSVRTLQEAEFTVFACPEILKRGTWASEICEEVKPLKGETIVPKFCHDPFFRPELDRILRELVPDPTKCYAIVTGGNINICVYATVMGFHLRDYWTVVPLDSVYYMSEGGYRAAVDQFSEGEPYPNIFLTRSDLIEVSHDPALLRHRPTPGC